MIDHIFTDIIQTDNFTALFEQTMVSNAYIIIYVDFNILILINKKNRIYLLLIEP